MKKEIWPAVRVPDTEMQGGGKRGKKEVFYWPENNAFSLAAPVIDDDYQMMIVGRGLVRIFWSVVAAVVAYALTYAVLKKPLGLEELEIPVMFLVPPFFLPAGILMLFGAYSCFSCPERYVRDGWLLIVVSWCLCFLAAGAFWAEYALMEGSVTMGIFGNLMMTASTLIWYYFLLRLAAGMECPEIKIRMLVAMVLYGCSSILAILQDIYEPNIDPMKLITWLLEPYGAKLESTVAYFSHLVGLMTIMAILLYVASLAGLVRRINQGNLP